jgi:uncharacterized protein YggT (Ycf19 family)
VNPVEEQETKVIETPTSSAREVREVSSTPHTTEVHSTVAPRTAVDRVDAVAYDPYEGRRIAALRLTQLVYWVFGLIEGLIVIRLVLKSLGANPAAGFSQFIYGITAPLVAPFVGLFNNPSYQGSVLELSSIIALIVYALAAWLIARLVWILVGETRSAIHTRSTQMDSHI